MIELIPSILLRFMDKKIGVISEIRKASHQISVAPEDRDYVEFLRWEHDQIQAFRHRHVVFGVNCRPFLLAEVIEYHCWKAPKEIVSCSGKLLESQFVENCHLLDTQAELEVFRKQSMELMKMANMNLMLWGKLEM